MNLNELGVIRTKTLLAGVIAFGIMIASALSLYNFYFVPLRAHNSQTLFQTNPYLYPLIFWIFPFASTIIFFIMIRRLAKVSGEEQQMSSSNAVGMFAMASFIMMYAALFVFIMLTAREYRLSQNILEQEAGMMHMLTFFGGTILSLIVGKVFIFRIFQVPLTKPSR
jgi:hypothetical protein